MSRFIMAAAVIENILYFSERYSNGLYQLNIHTGEYSFIDYFFDERPSEWLYFQAYVWEKKIYFIPGLAENIACFDTVSKQITYIKLPEEGIVIHGVNRLCAEKFCCQKYENILWMMPVGYNLFLKFDMSNEKLYKIDLPQKIHFVEGIFNWRMSCLHGKELVFQPWAGDIQVRYNIISGLFKMDYFLNKIRIYRNYFHSGNFEIYVPWELKNGLMIKDIINKKEKIFFWDNCVKKDTCDISILIENKLYLFPQIGKKVVIFSILNFHIEYIDLNIKFNKDYESWAWMSIAEDKYKYYIFSSIISEILEIDKKNAYMKLVKVKRENYDSKKKHFHICLKNLNRKVFQEERKDLLNESKDELEQLFVQMNAGFVNEQTLSIYNGKKIYIKMKEGLT